MDMIGVGIYISNPSGFILSSDAEKKPNSSREEQTEKGA